MNILHIFDENNYEPNWNRICREAVRGIIFRDNQIAMVKSEKEGYYKFPGGGAKRGESHLDTLVRETREETGLQILPDTISEFGMLREIRKSVYGEEIFDHKSYYYLANVSSSLSEKDLDDYEKELGYHLVFIEPQIAYEVNMQLANNCAANFLLREAYILKLLIDGINKHN